jgi:predicted house-cleaning noncanonical NTP pyrophosphatase (MazG superfamily)
VVPKVVGSIPIAHPFSLKFAWVSYIGLILHGENLKTMTLQDQSLEELFERFKDFSKKTFIDAESQSYLKKLEEEVVELKEDTNMEELADCMLVLVGLSRFIEGDLKEALRQKVLKNERRTWIRMPDGTYHHQ